MRCMSDPVSPPEALLRAGLAFIATAPPEVGTRLPRGARLVLQSRLLAALLDWSPPYPFRICWRTVFSWGNGAHITCGTVRWRTATGASTAAFAVDPQGCTLGPASLPDVAMLALRLARRSWPDAA